MRLKIIIFLITFASLACERHAGFKNANGIYFQLQELGEDTVKAKPGDYITANICYKTFSDSVFIKGIHKFQLSRSSSLESLEECVKMLSRGDKAVFIISAKDFLKDSTNAAFTALISSEELKLEIKILNIQSEKEYQQEKEAFLKWTEDFSETEKTLLTHFIEGKKINVAPTASGLYYIPKKAGKGKKAEAGKVVEIRYTGKFLDGKFIGSMNSPQTLAFVYGTEMQVIPGLNEAIGLMSEGEKALVIIPSELAWGVNGSSTGMVPPYTSTLFEIELLSVKEP